MKKTILTLVLVATFGYSNSQTNINDSLLDAAAESLTKALEENNDTVRLIDNFKREYVPQMDCSFIPMLKNYTIKGNFCGSDGIFKTYSYCYNFYTLKSNTFSKSIRFQSYNSSAKDELTLVDEWMKFASNMAIDGKYQNKGEVVYNGRSFILLFKKEEFFDMNKNYGEFVMIGINNSKNKDIFTIIYKIETLYESRFYDQYFTQLNDLMKSIIFN